MYLGFFYISVLPRLRKILKFSNAVYISIGGYYFAFVMNNIKPFINSPFPRCRSPPKLMPLVF